jgi:aryl-alcohol dehydrogenase-like predicted oxidoreductase
MQYRRLGRTGLKVSEIGLGVHGYRRKSLAMIRTSWRAS